MTVRPAKTQICPVWSESSLCTQWVAKDPSFLNADSEDTNQTGLMPWLIGVFTGRTCHFVGFVTGWLKNSGKRTFQRILSNNIWQNVSVRKWKKRKGQKLAPCLIPFKLLFYYFSGERPFECDICQKRFTLKHSMMRHRKKHAGAPPRSFDDDEDSLHGDDYRGECWVTQSILINSCSWYSLVLQLTTKPWFIHCWSWSISVLTHKKG